MSALNVLAGGVLASDLLTEFTDERPKHVSPLLSSVNGVTVPVEQDMVLRVDEDENSTFSVSVGQEVHFFQDPDYANIQNRSIVFGVYQGKACVAVYRRGVGITEKTHYQR